MGSKVTVFFADFDDNYMYEGDFDAGLAPGGQLIISENVSNDDGVAHSGATSKNVIRCIYNKNSWERAEVT